MVNEELSVSPFDNMLMIYAMKVTEKINEKEECYYVEFKNFLKLTFLSLFPTRVFTLSTTLKKKGEKVNFFFFLKLLASFVTEFVPSEI